MSPPALTELADRSPLSAFRERLVRSRRTSVAAAVVALAAGVAVFAIATTVFAYHSSNHDEAVYLLQAAMLLEGQLELHAGDLAGAFRPWFFIADGGRLYPKYTPVPAAMYAVSMALFGEPRVTLAAVAAGNAALVYLLGATVFDRRVGVVAATLFAASPMALVTSAAFLPYAPTAFLNLAFAVAYLRGVRDESAVLAAAAGVAIGLAFFARPYTAVLFAAPFVCHALWRVASTLRERGFEAVLGSGPVRRHGLTAVGGLLFVGVTLAYNARLTGSPLVFPYEAFAPLDGPGFGRRRILDHAITYTPDLALDANGYALWYFATRWFVAGPVGTALAAAGAGLALRRWYGGDSVAGADDRRFQRTAGLLLVGLFVTVPVGNVLFWGNYNVLATMSDPTDGLVSQFGPFYHFDLLVPLSLFAAVAALAGWRRLVPAVRSALRERSNARTARAVVVGGLAVSVLVVGGADAALVSTPLERNAMHADKYETAYEPVESAAFEDALVFVPTPYGDWQNHPFQVLRNDPGFDGEVVYALDRDPDGDFAVVDAYSNRTRYRYTYRGEWTPNANQHVTPKLEQLEVRTGDRLAGETTVGVPARVERASVRLENGAGRYAEYSVADPDEQVVVPWTVDGERATLRAGNGSVPVDGPDELALTVTLVGSDGSTLTYRQETTVRTTGGGVEAVWPPERSVCPLVTDCGREGTYLPERPETHRAGVSFETTLEPT